MAVLEKIRVKFGLAASIIIALGLLSFIIDPNELMSAFQIMSSKYDVGQINGKAISYNDFQEEVQNFTTINEMITGSSAQTAEQQDQIREATWQNLVFKHLFLKKARAAGLNVGDEEMLDLTYGDRISPVISQNPAFFDENGNFSKENLKRFIDNLDSDNTGSLRQYWNYVQNSIYNQEFMNKYNALFSQSDYLNPLMLKRVVADNNNTSNVDFVMVPFGYETDSTIVVSDNEIRNFYSSHKKFYKQNASRDMEYVVFEVTPSADDIAAVSNQVAELHSEFAVAENLKSFLLKNSERAYSDEYYKPGEFRSVSPEVEDFVWNGKENISKVITNGNKFFIARIVDSRMIPDSVYVRHILLQGDKAESQADSLLGALRGGSNFSNLASLYSLDKNSADKGQKGNIGWMTKNYMIPGFESVLTAESGKPYVVKTQYGTHIVEVTDKTKPVLQKKVALFEKEALPSKETFNKEYSKANAFAAAAVGGYQNYKKAVDTLGVYSHPFNNMLESNDKLGSIDNAKEVTRWVFDNKVGKVSNIITVNNNFFIVATVKAIHKEGYADVKDVAASIKQQLYYEKLGVKKAAEVKEKIAGLDDLQAIADKLGTSVSSQNDVAFASMNVQGLDPKFIGALSVAPEGKISGPVAGSIGVYVFKVTGRDTGAFFTDDDARNREKQMSQYSSQMIIPVMMADAEVKDNRARFY